MTLEQLQTLQSLARKARQDFLKELLEGKNNYPLLAKKTGLDLKQLYRIVNGESQPKLEALVDAYIKLLQKPVAD